MVCGWIGAKVSGLDWVAYVVGPVLVGVIAPLSEHWFRVKEVQTERSAGGFGVLGSMSDVGALISTRIIILETMQAIQRASGDVRACSEALVANWTRLHAVLGGNASVPGRLQDTHVRNQTACARLEDVQDLMLEAVTGLNLFQPVVA
jgi:hypothetical protein